MNRRETLRLLGATAVAAATTFTSRLALAAEPSMVVVVKIAGIPWFNALEKGVMKGGAGLQDGRLDGGSGERRPRAAGQAA